MYLGVDLAANLSAALLLDVDGQVIDQWDSWGVPVWEFCRETVHRASRHKAILMVEDLPYGLSRQAQIKPPIRAQGMMIAHAALQGIIPQTLFIAPATWQRDYPGVWKGGKEGAAAAAELLGYTPPDLLTQYVDTIPALGKEHAKERSKIRAQLKKLSTDYTDAYLIAEFTRRKSIDGTLTTLQGVQSVTKD